MIIKIIIDVLLFILGYIISYLVNKYDINTYLKYIRCNKYIYRELKDQINYHKFGNLSFEDYKNKIIEAITYELSLNRSIMDTDFNDFYNNTTKKSINYQDILQYDCVHIEKHLLKANYRYEIKNLLDEIIKKGEYNAKKDI